MSKMFISIKNKRENKYIEAKDLEVNGITLEELYKRMEHAEGVFKDLIDQLQECFVIKKDQPYIVDVGTLERVPRLQIYENIDPGVPLKLCKIVDGKIVIDKKKVGAL
jgi:hypothetical protein